MRRVVEPELLDELPAGDPRAIQSRRDLRRINFLMGNVPLLARLLRTRLTRPPRTMVDLGSGDGTVALALARRLGWTKVKVELLDFAPVVSGDTLRAFAALGWDAEVLQVDLCGWVQQSPKCDLLVANLFLHHFQDEELRALFESFSQIAGTVASCDPRRWWPALVATRLLGAIGCNAVTRHDARASVRAGFSSQELSALWPRESGCALWEGPGGYASHLFLATRDTPKVELN